MSGGKETPRQKMIGMMYLVLTALLALNVSKSILDAFVAIEENTQKANIVQVERGNFFIEEIQSELATTPKDVANEQKREKLEIVLEKMKQIDFETGNIIHSIDNLKLLILKKSGENITSINNLSGEHILWSEYNAEDDEVLPARMNLMAVQSKDQFDVPMHEIIGGDIKSPNGEGIKLWNDLIDYRRKIVQLSGEYSWNGKDHKVNVKDINSYSDVIDLRKQVSEMLKSSSTNHVDDDPLLSELYISLTKLERNEVNGMSDVHWIGATFDHSPLVAAIASLSSLQQDILSARALAIAHWKTKVSTGEFSFNEIMALSYGPVVANEGDSVSVQVMMAAFNSDNQPTVTVDENFGTVVYPGNGQGIVQFKAGGSTIKLTGTVSVKNKSGVPKTKKWEHTVQIMKPQGSIELPHLNVLYKGYSNLVQPTASGFPETVLKGSGNLLITKTNEGYIVKASGSSNSAKLMVYGKTITDELVLLRTVTYKVNKMPKPSLYWGATMSGGRVNTSSNVAIVKYQPGIPLVANFSVLDWEISTSNSNGRSKTGNGSNFSSAASMIRGLPANTKVSITVHIRYPSGVRDKIVGVWTK